MRASPSAQAFFRGWKTTRHCHSGGIQQWPPGIRNVGTSQLLISPFRDLHVPEPLAQPVGMAYSPGRGHTELTRGKEVLHSRVGALKGTPPGLVWKEATE